MLRSRFFVFVAYGQGGVETSMGVNKLMRLVSVNEVLKFTGSGIH